MLSLLRFYVFKNPKRDFSGLLLCFIHFLKLWVHTACWDSWVVSAVWTWWNNNYWSSLTVLT